MLLHGEHATIAQHDAETKTLSCAFTHERIILDALRNIIGIVIDGLTIVRRNRLEHTIAHTLSIYVELVKSDTCHIGRCTLDLFILQLKLLTQIAGSHTGVHTTLFARQQLFQTYPIATPFAFIKQSDAKALVTAPVRFASSSPYFYFPGTEGVALQLLTSIGNPQLLVALHLARIPHFALIITDNKLIGRLANVLFVAYDPPRETGLGSINA